MTQATQRAAILAIVQSVDDVGNVYNRQRWAIRWDDILDLLKTTVDGTDQIRTWIISCTGFNDEYLNGELNEIAGKVAMIRTWDWRIQGFLTFNDDENTEETALNLGTSVVNALNLAASLHDGNTYFGEQPPARMGIFELRLFAGVLCHYTEISQQLTEAVGLSS